MGCHERPDAIKIPPPEGYTLEVEFVDCTVKACDFSDTSTKAYSERLMLKMAQ